jgi:hypothetical protein
VPNNGHCPLARRCGSNRSDSSSAVGDDLEPLPKGIETLKAALIVAQAEAAAARARQSDYQALIAHLKLQIENSLRSAVREVWSTSATEPTSRMLVLGKAQSPP